jgi:hypothetical protein
MQFLSGSCYIFPFWSKYLPRHPLRNIFRLGRFFSVRDEALDPDKTTHTLVIPYILAYYWIESQKLRSSGPKGSRFSVSSIFLNFSWLQFWFVTMPILIFYASLEMFKPIIISINLLHKFIMLFCFLHSIRKTWTYT